MTLGDCYVLMRLKNAFLNNVVCPEEVDYSIWLFFLGVIWGSKSS